MTKPRQEAPANTQESENQGVLDANEFGGALTPYCYDCESFIRDLPADRKTRSETHPEHSVQYFLSIKYPAGHPKG